MHKDFCFLATINSFDYLTNSLLVNIEKGILLSWFDFCFINTYAYQNAYGHL